MCEETLIDVDNMLWHAGDFGNYQLILMCLFSVINVLSAFHYFGQTFLIVVPEHKCLLDLFGNDSIAMECSKVILNGTGTFQEIDCDSGWTYKNTNGYVSIVEELNWVCEDSWKPAVGQSVFFIGSVIGSLVFGVLADRIGRLHVLVAANIVAFVGNIIAIFSTNVTVFSISRFVAGAATDSNFVMMYIIVMEYIRPSMRTFGLNVCIGVFYCLSCMIVPWVAALLGHWRTLILVISLPHLTVLSYYFMVPESAQWLISKGRTEDAIRCFKIIADINGKTIKENCFEGLRRYCNKYYTEVRKHENLLGLLRTPKLRKKTIILTFKSMVMTLCYDAISRNVNGLSYSPFVIFTATSATILPACLFILAIQDRVGRKALASGSFLFSGIFTAGSGLIQILYKHPNRMLILILAIVARLGITIAYNSGHQYAVELIPTVVRGQGVSAIHVAGFAATFFSPQVLFLANVWKPAPEVILGVLLISGAISCLFLPETLNKTLPVTLQDGEDFGEDEGIFEFACSKAPTDSTTQLVK